MTGALWLYLEESNRWRLFIISPLVDDVGPREGYGHIQAALSQLPGTSLSLSDISVIGVGGENFQGLVGNIKAPWQVDPSLVGKPHKDMMFENAYIYGLQDA